MSLSESIRDLRMKCLLSQAEFARQIHVATISINRWENGKTKPNISAMKNIRDFCKANNYSFDSIEAEWLKEQE